MEKECTLEKQYYVTVLCDTKKRNVPQTAQEDVRFWFNQDYCFNTELCFSSSATNWASGEDDHVVARAEFDFTAASDEEISLRTGDMINLAPKGESTRITFSS